MTDSLSVDHLDRTLTVNKPEWEWEFIRRAIHEQGRHQKAKGNNDRSADLYEISIELVEPYPEITFTLSQWALIAAEIDAYSTHLKLGFNESIADEYMNYVEEIQSLVRFRDRE